MFAPAARSCSTTAACPSIAAESSGVFPSCGARQRSDRHPLSPRKCVRPLPYPCSSALPNLEGDKPGMARDGSLAATPRCYQKVGLDWQTFAVTAKVLADVNKMINKSRAPLAPPPTPTTLFTTPAYGSTKEAKEIKSLSRKTMMARRVAILTLAQYPDPPKDE